MAPSVKILSDQSIKSSPFKFTQKKYLPLVKSLVLDVTYQGFHLGKINLVKIGTALESDPMNQCI